MTSDYYPPGGEKAVAKYQATRTPVDPKAEALNGPAFQWVLMKDVDAESGYQTPSPPRHSPQYEGQIVVVPAVLEKA